MDNNLSGRILGAPVNNADLGRGYITNFFRKSDGEYYVSVAFNKVQTEKTYLANTAFFKGVLALESEELNNDVKLALLRYKAKLEQEKRVATTNKTKGPSQNEKVNYLVSKVMSGRTIAVDLIEVYDDPIFEKTLCEESFTFLERIMEGASLTRPQRACVVCGLSLIALKCYDGDLHTHIENKYREYRPSTQYYFSRSAIQNGVYKVIGDFRAQIKYFDPQSYVAVPIVLCCIPHYRLKDLFKISYDIYEKKLLCDENLSDDQICEKVVETFNALRRKDLLSDSDTIKGTNYLMSKYTQSCIHSGYGIEDLAQVVAYCIRLMILHLSRPEDSFKVKTYYREAYETWTSNFDSDEKEKSKYEKRRFISQPYFKLENNTVYLTTGEYNLDDTVNPNEVHICVYNKDQLIEDRLITDPNAIMFSDETAAISGYILKRQRFEIPVCPLGNLSYIITCSGRTLGDSKSRLYRDVLFFDGSGKEVKPGTNYSGSLFALTKYSLKEEYGEDIKESKSDGYYISIIEVNDHDSFRFDSEPYIFYKITNAQLIGYEIPWCLFTSLTGKQFPVYSEVTILFPSSCEKEDISLVIDDHEYNYSDVSDVSFSARLFSKEHGGVSTYLIKVFGLPPGFHTIRVYNSASERQINGGSFKVVYDPEMKKSFFSRNDKGIIYSLESSFLDNQPLMYEYGVPRKELKAFVKSLGPGTIVIYPTTISYSVDGSAWTNIDNKLYLCDLPVSVKTISLCGPTNMVAYSVVSNEREKKQKLAINVDPEYPCRYTVHISHFRTIKGEKNAKLSLEYQNKTKYLIISYFPFVYRDDCKFYYDKEEGVHRFVIRYEGSSKIKAIVQSLKPEMLLASREIYSGVPIEIKETDIPRNVRSLSVSLYGRKYDALFDPYQTEPFLTFPKYDLGRVSVKVYSLSEGIKVDKGVLSCRVSFEGADTIRADVLPTGFNTPLLSKHVHSGATLALNISALPFNSYIIRLYNSTNETAEKGEEEPFYYSPQIRVDSPFLKHTFPISTVTLTDGSKIPVAYSIRFMTIEEIDKKYYLIATLKDKRSDTIIDKMAVTDIRFRNKKYDFLLRHRTSVGLKKLKFSNGKVIDRAEINI